MFFKDDRVFAASKDKDVVELNMNLDVVKKYSSNDTHPLTIDANENYLVVGYMMPPSFLKKGRTCFSGCVDVHSRTELDRFGTHRQRTVGSFYVTVILFIIEIPSRRMCGARCYQKRNDIFLLT